MHSLARPKSSGLRFERCYSVAYTPTTSSLYIHFILANKEKGARSKIMGPALYKRLTYNRKEGTTLLKLIYGQLYNGKLANDHVLIVECPLYHKLDSNMYIAGEFPDHEALLISRHNAACRLVHAAIR